MKALTICQPYAELILLGEKRVENRTWSTPFRGKILLHAGKSRAWLDSYSPLPERMDFGAIVGRMELVECVAKSKLENWRRFGLSSPSAWLLQHPHSEGPILWVLGKVARLATPIPWRGAQGLFDVPDRELQRHNPRWLAVDGKR